MNQSEFWFLGFGLATPFQQNREHCIRQGWRRCFKRRVVASEALHWSYRQIPLDIVGLHSYWIFWLLLCICYLTCLLLCIHTHSYGICHKHQFHNDALALGYFSPLKKSWCWSYDPKVVHDAGIETIITILRCVTNQNRGYQTCNGMRDSSAMVFSLNHGFVRKCSQCTQNCHQFAAKCLAPNFYCTIHWWSLERYSEIIWVFSTSGDVSNKTRFAEFAANSFSHLKRVL